jgi:protein arginine kinase
MAAIAQGQGCWFDPAGPESDTVLSTRIRLARNLDGTRFTWRATDKELDAILEDVLAASTKSPGLHPHETLIMADLPSIDRDLLVERHLISAEFARGDRARALIPGATDAISIMVNEEDHLRIQSLRGGFQLVDCWEAVAAVDTVLGDALDFAFRDDIGFLTTCPSNVGCGLRVSVLVHLPSLVLTQEIERVIEGVHQIGLTVRGFYGEGSNVVGHFFQISNQITLGKNEEELLDMLEQVVRDVVRYELNAREWLMTDARDQILDKIYRALGMLSGCRVASSAEVMAASSALRLGVSIGLSEMPSLDVLNRLLVFSQPAHLTRLAGRALSSPERRALRARLVRGLVRGDRVIDASNGER